MDNHLKTLADIVSSKDKVMKYTDNENKLPQNYINLIDINKNIINILNEMEDPKPIEYALLGEFQKMFLLREDIKNKELKDNLDELSEIVSTEDSIKKYEGKQEFPIIMNKLIQIDKDIINILNEIEDSPINYDDHLGKIQKIFLTRGLKTDEKKKSSKKKPSIVTSHGVLNLKTIKDHLKNNIRKLISCNDNKYTLKKILNVPLEEILDVKLEDFKDKACKKIINQFLSGSIEYFYTKSFYKNEKSKAIRKAKKKLSEEYNKLKIKLDNIEEKLSEEYNKLKIKLDNIEEKIENNIKNNEYKKYKEKLQYNNADKLKINIDFIKNILDEEELTIKKILEILFLFDNKTYESYFMELNKQLSKRSKYKKLLKDINYIKKYMKYKMKYYIMLKKNNLSN